MSGVSELFKCRASAVGNIVSGIGFDPIPLTDKQCEKLDELRAKGSKSKELQNLEAKLVEIPENKLSTGAKTYVQDWWYGKYFDFQKTFWNKFVDKGINKEGYSITQINEALGVFATKNKNFFENDYIHGTPDMLINGRVLDAKNVYFPKGLSFFESSEESNYIWQIHAYNWLTERNMGHVVRVLVNPPENVLSQEAYSLWRQAGNEGYFDDDFLEDVRDYYNFEKKPVKDRIRVFDVETTEKDINIIKEAVRLSNEYIKELNAMFKTRKNYL